LTVFDFLKELTNPESIIKYGGITLLLFIVFAETGLLIGFFLPGDSLLFTSGLLCGIGIFKINILLLVFGLCLAAIIGNIVGYFFGLKAGTTLFKKNDSLIFKKKYLQLTHNFYTKHGGKTLILGRFLPIVRTFAPILAGVIKIDFKKFMYYNIIGSFLWVLTLVLCGYFLGKNFPWLNNYLEYIVVLLIIITLIPLLQAYFKRIKTPQA